MCDKNLNENSNKKKTTSCGCAQSVNGHNCPCKKRICLPILGVVGLVIVASVAAKRRNRR